MRRRGTITDIFLVTRMVVGQFGFLLIFSCLLRFLFIGLLVKLNLPSFFLVVMLASFLLASLLLASIVFASILLAFILFAFIPFASMLFASLLFASILFVSILFALSGLLLSPLLSRSLPFSMVPSG